ncbi:energy transducer TonB [Flavobacterium sp. Root901]|uniref:energy transducer TonB n=1 Tax=Flavobacterium sp. Root901 TaxID=1736605 RepID=UPI00070A7FEF|nr:energy transducer TonB [Flavobacterium sp. Root901]
MKNLILLLTLLITTISFAQTESQVNREETRTVEDKMEATQRIVDYENEIFRDGSIEINPEYPGGPEAVDTYLKKKIKVSKEELEKQGNKKIYAQFVIEKNGSLSDIKVLNSSSTELSEEFTKALKKMPKWKPAKQNNQIVRSSYILVFKPNTN